MRIGNNPEKTKHTEILYKKHRIIIPVYIPASNDEYFKNLLEVYKTSMDSLFATIDVNTTVITIINNNCKQEVTEYINSLLAQKLIDKHVVYQENYGKVFAILSEARASYEDFISIADADVFYFNEWENKVFEIFEAFDRAGVVSPVPSPHLTFYNNVSLFGNLFHFPKKANVVTADSFKFLEEGTSNPEIFNHKKQNWKKKQFYLEKQQIKACVGSGHFVATYRNVFKEFECVKPVYVFKNGDENFYLDLQFDQLGYYRLSTLETKAYHLGNTIPEWTNTVKHKGSKTLIKATNKIKHRFHLPQYFFRKFIYKVLKKIKFI
ncbi:glycosyltransferase family A protein [Flavicella sediminum]|uniref:glycosyltransferase family A protein n=1 Tax=Flavicella sediminum TaxID=2585141 RepID=UPI0011212E3B|nr:glycosyltransferase family 2 protein [Flavicella sediminum]